MKRVVVVHGWDGHSEEAWFPWLKRELEKKGFTTYVPLMPEPSAPHIERWVPFLANLIGEPDKDTCLVGHSAGCITILRYLEGLPAGKKVGKAVLVAGFTDNLGFKELDNFFRKPIEWNKIKLHCGGFVAINSDNDPYVKLYHSDVFKEKLSAKVIIERRKGHMGGDDNMKELPSVLRAIIKS